ncbi:MAG: GIY-YIG nuclease family protein [bacterium]|nr:GIY-YIG nuclease family protein [bacterium]
MFFTYILKSEKDESYYMGSTDDIEKRIIRHNKGYSRYTKNRGPFKLVYRENYNTRSEAKKREYYLKSLKSRIAIEKLISRGPIV